MDWIGFAVGWGILAGLLLARAAWGQTTAAATLEKAGLLVPAFQSLVDTLKSIAGGLALALLSVLGYAWTKTGEVLKQISGIKESVGHLQTTIDRMEAEAQDRSHRLLKVERAVVALSTQATGHIPSLGETSDIPSSVVREVRAPGAVKRTATGG